jgi:hypothetical protein
VALKAAEQKGRKSFQIIRENKKRL